VEHVVHVSVDGLAGIHLKHLIDTLPPEELPNFRRLIAEGASTFNARNDYGHAKTAPNHATILTGRPVLQPAGQDDHVHHGYTNNGTPLPGETLWNQGNPQLTYTAGIFDVAHDWGLSTGLYVSKGKFRIFDQSWDQFGAPDSVGQDNGPVKVDQYKEESTGPLEMAALLHAFFLAELGQEHREYSFVHYRDPDTMGHEYGWYSTEYDDAIEGVDVYLGDIRTLIETDPELAGRTTLILSTDHGGDEQGHDDPANPLIYTIPFFVWGAGVDAGADLYVLNPKTRLDPGTGRPDYDAPLQPIRSGDGANLALRLLGLPPVPGSTINFKQDLLVHAAPEMKFYGSGVNPASSLTVLSGVAEVSQTVRLGLDNPLATQAPGATLPYVALSIAPDPAYPCGTLLPSFGMGGPLMDGELLISLAPNELILPLLTGPAWQGPGIPAPVDIPIPANPMWVGTVLYAQGVLIDSAGPVYVGLTEAVALSIGP
jgi:hypothetical protein